METVYNFFYFSQNFAVRNEIDLLDFLQNKIPLLILNPSIGTDGYVSMRDRRRESQTIDPSRSSFSESNSEWDNAGIEAIGWLYGGRSP